MITVNVYLTFKGNCREAFEFYKQVFNGNFSDVNTFAEMPPQEGMPPFPDEMKNQIMHICLPISNETMLMGSDAGGEWAPDLKPGNNFSISVNADSKEKALRIFDGLSKEGQITMPLNETFWGAYFGMITDQFGINWMVSCELKSQKDS